MSLQTLKNQKGFTIVELLIVIVVIGILAAITIVAFNGIQNRGKSSASQSLANSVVKKAEAWNSVQGSYPSYCQLKTNSLTPTVGTGDTCTAGGTTGPGEAKLDDTSSITTSTMSSTVSNNGKVVTYPNTTTNSTTASVIWYKFDGTAGNQTISIGS